MLCCYPRVDTYAYYINIKMNAYTQINARTWETDSEEIRYLLTVRFFVAVPKILIMQAKQLLGPFTSRERKCTRMLQCVYRICDFKSSVVKVVPHLKEKVTISNHVNSQGTFSRFTWLINWLTGLDASLSQKLVNFTSWVPWSKLGWGVLHKKANNASTGPAIETAILRWWFQTHSH